MLGLDVLVNTANVIYLISYSVREILWLRVLTVIGATLLLPYYYFQDDPLWAPIAWNLIFTAINLFWITKLLLDRRPVPFDDTERRLYELALRTMSERDAYRLFRVGKWSTVPSNTALLTQGGLVQDLSLIVEGEVTIELDGAEVDRLRDGRYLGCLAFLHRREQCTASVTVRTTAPTRIIEWPLERLRSAFEKDADLEVAVEASIGLEIGRFLDTARAKLI